MVTDRRGRALHDLRISVTDRCNFRCLYCMPKEIFGRDFAFLPKESLLTFEEITRVAGVAVGLGVRKIRLTGGEPLLRTHLENLVAELAALRAPDGEPVDLALTTNGSVLAHKAAALKEAGLRRITVSLDSLDDATFRAMNDVDFPVARVLAGIDAAREVGLSPIKVNMVVRRGHNEHDVVPMARHFKGTGTTLRFIEYMDVGSTNGWQLTDVVPAAEVIAAIDAELPLEAVPPAYPGEVATRWRYRDGDGEVGVIGSVTQPFCGSCTRVRLSTDGKLFTCLFANRGTDVRGMLRDGATDDDLRDLLSKVWRSRDDRYSEIRSSLTPALAPKEAGTPERATPGRTDGESGDEPRRIEMSYIGG